MFVVKKTGLVPVTSTKRGGRTGIFGVPPAIARKGVLAGEFALADVPNHIEVYEVEDPAPDKGPVALEAVTDEEIVIPANWEEQHPLTWIKLAKKISGQDIVLTDDQKKAEIKPSQIAKDIIVFEIQRRAAAETPAE